MDNALLPHLFLPFLLLIFFFLISPSILTHSSCFNLHNPNHCCGLRVHASNMADEAPKRSTSSSHSSDRANLDAPTRPTPQRTHSQNMRLGLSPSPSHSHRQSFTDSLRGMPPSPRQNRHPSLSQMQIQDLLNNPPTSGHADPRFAGRDWQHISVGELVLPEELRLVELDTGIEDATNVRLHLR